MRIYRLMKLSLVAGITLLVVCMTFMIWILPMDSIHNSINLEHAGRTIARTNGGESRHRDAVFDRQALRDADPAKGMMLILDEQAPFPVAASFTRMVPLIPHIIHQTFDSVNIPRTFEPWIRKLMDHHRGWEYWFWTPRAVSCLLDRHYPTHSSLFTEYPDDISRADVMRYFVLHQFGGVYTDLDSIALKPLDPWTYSHHCLLSQEPYEHTFIIRGQNQSNIVNSPLACSPKHPFYSRVIASLAEFAQRFFGDVIRSTGPFFLDTVYRRVSKRYPDTINITVLPPRFFLPTYDPSQTGIIDDRCSIQNYKTLREIQRTLCERLIDRDYKNKPYPDSFMDHFWFHTNVMHASWKLKNTKHISQIVPYVKNMEVILC